MRLISSCPICGKKNVSAKSRSKFGTTLFVTLDCGHTYHEKGLAVSEIDEIILSDNRKLYPFQTEGVKFIERSNFRCQISDEMGLGKTIQAIGAVNLHYDDLKPILIIVKASLTFNWLREVVKGSGRLAQVFESGDSLLPNVGIVIVSYDTLIPRKVKGSEFKVNDKNFETLKAFKPKTVILDEVQMIKNHNAKRTQAIRDLIRTKVDYTPQVPQPLKRKRIEMIANDLLNYHGLKGRFDIEFPKLHTNVLGLCECKVLKDGIIVGRISIDNVHAETASEDEIIETILHEIAHAITPGAGHRPIWSKCAKSIGSTGEQFAWCNGTKESSTPEKENMVKHIISLSGTPIKNNALEYFPILNLLHPEMFPDLKRFENMWVDYYFDGNTYKPGGIKYIDSFMKQTKDFILRRTRDEVLPDLPKIIRDFKYYKMGDIVRKEYGKRVKGLEKFLGENEKSPTSAFYTDLMAYLSVLRHITGLSKIEPSIEYINEFIENGGEKIVLFHHHIDVGDVLVAKLNEAGISNIRIISADNSETRLDKIDKFKIGDAKVLIAPTLACGEGINLQFCSNAILLEREWNPANEEQVEGRFSRIGSISSAIDVCYPTAVETIDEYFAEIVERKRSIVSNSLDGIASDWNESQVMLELANLVVKKWRY
jgi:SNF2 family DNA or RNA helicase